MGDPRDTLDLTNARTPDQAPADAAPARGARPWLGLFFRCAGRYSRAYRTADGAAYVGRCPKCSKSVRFVVGRGGTSERMFEVDC